jgi:CRISPR-associated protein Cas5h
MDVLSLRWHAKYGHFLRAEANASAVTYPVPPRPAILGMLAAILGLEKDALPEVLGTARIAVTLPKGLPARFTHRVKLRKDPPSTLPWTVKKTQKSDKNTAPEKATLNLQEWLWQPDFHIHVALPERVTVLAELKHRVEEQRWHFCPCMGLSELLAEIDFLGYAPATALPGGAYTLEGVCVATALDKLHQADGLGIHLLRLPWQINAERVFQHQNYYLEHRGQAFSAETAHAWQLGGMLKETQVVFS